MQGVAYMVRHLIIYEHSVVGACIYVVAVQCERLDGVAHERRYGLECAPVVTVERALGAYPHGMCATVWSESVDERLRSVAYRYGAYAAARRAQSQSVDCSDKQSARGGQQRVHVLQLSVLQTYVVGGEVAAVQSRRAAHP